MQRQSEGKGGWLSRVRSSSTFFTRTDGTTGSPFFSINSEKVTFSSANSNQWVPVDPVVRWTPERWMFSRWLSNHLQLRPVCIALIPWASVMEWIKERRSSSLLGSIIEKSETDKIPFLSLRWEEKISISCWEDSPSINQIFFFIFYNCRLKRGWDFCNTWV